MMSGDTILESQEGKEGTCQLWKRTENKVMLTKKSKIFVSVNIHWVGKGEIYHLGQERWLSK